MRHHKSAELIKAPFESLAHLNSVASPPPPLLNHHLLEHGECSLSRLHLPSFPLARSPARRSAAPVSLLCVNSRLPPHIRSPRLYFKDDEAIVLQTPLKAKCAIRRGGGGERASGERRERGVWGVAVMELGQGFGFRGVGVQACLDMTQVRDRRGP